MFSCISSSALMPSARRRSSAKPPSQQQEQQQQQQAANAALSTNVKAEMSAALTVSANPSASVTDTKTSDRGSVVSLQPNVTATASSDDTEISQPMNSNVLADLPDPRGRDPTEKLQTEISKYFLKAKDRLNKAKEKNNKDAMALLTKQIALYDSLTKVFEVLLDHCANKDRDDFFNVIDTLKDNLISPNIQLTIVNYAYPDNSIRKEKLLLCGDEGEESAYLVLPKAKKTLFGSVKFGVLCNNENGVFHQTNIQRAFKFSNIESVQSKIPIGSKDICAEDPIEELAILKYLNSPGHPNIIQLFGCYETQRDIVAIFEKAEISIMDALLESKRDANRLGFDDDLTMLTITQLLDGIGYMHSMGICHLDVSLENAMFSEGRTMIKIIDMGMARQMRLLDKNSGKWEKLPYVYDKRGKAFTPGKERYKAPEIKNPPTMPIGASPTSSSFPKFDGVAADIWSLGISFYCLLTGAQVYQEATNRCPFFQFLEKNGVRGYIKGKNHLPLFSPNGNEAGMQLLENMINFDPEKRLNATSLRQLPFFKPPAQ